MKKNLDYYGLFKPNSNWHKFILTMKITAFLLFCSLVNIFAAPTYSQATKISLHLKDATIEEVLSKIEDVSEFYFLYNNKLIDVTRKVNIEADKEPIKDILNDILNKDTKFIVYDRQIILTPSDVISLSAALQQLKITGTVTGKDGAPLPGVNVVITGTLLGTTTNVDGKFTIAVPTGSKSLTFSFIGMDSQEVNIGTLTQINVTMAESSISLDDVVVIGYGTQKKINTTGAISTVRTDELKDVSNSSISQLLEGKLAGVSITKTNGKPGAGADILIRGVGTFGDNSPLIVIDGQPADYGFESLDPNNIESVNVLKDAASAAIYGSRAANGVILITTKRGKLGAGTLELNVYRSWQKLQKHITMCNAEQFVELQNEAIRNRNDIYGSSLDVYFPEGPEAWKGKGTDWTDVMFRTAPIASYNLAAQGGSERIKYRISNTWLTQEGILINTGFDKAISNINLDIQITDKLKFGSSLNLTYSHTYGGNKVVGLINDQPPTIPVYEPDGSPGYGKNSGEDGYSLLFQQKMDNPFTDAYRAVGNMFLEYDITDFLRFHVNGGIDFVNSRYKNFIEKFNVANKYMNTQNNLTDNRSNGISWVNDYLLYFDKVFAKSHTVNAMAGFTQQLSFNENSNGYVTNFISEAENNQVLDGGTNSAEARSSGSRSELALRSYFGRVNYSYLDKYLLSFNIRADASSRFSKENQWGYFPSMSAAWVISNESFFNLAFVNRAKLRINRGKLGNQSIGSFYPTIAALSQGVIPLGPGGPGNIAMQPMVYQSSLINRDLRWETTIISNIGIDLGLLNNRLNATFDYFIKDTKDILTEKIVPMSVGLGAPFVNFAEVKNTGIEIELGWKDHIGNDFIYNMGLNFSKFKNEVVKLNEGQDIVFKSLPFHGTYINQVGEPMNSFYGYESDGIYQNQAELDAVVYPGSYVGSRKFKDLNGDGKITEQDRKILGNAYPDLLFGFNLSAKYKKFDFMIVCHGNFGKKQYQPTIWGNNAAFRNCPDVMLGRWTGEGSTNKLPRWVWNDVSDEVMSSAKIPDVSYAKLQTISLGYTIDAKKFGNIRAYIAGENLITLTNKDYVGWDPEITGLEPNDNFYPGAAVYTIGFNFTF